MTDNTLQQLKQQADTLTLEEKLELIAYLAEKARQAQPTNKPRQKWSEIRGLAAAPALNEDAQTWVSRTRQEADEHRER
ncbi:hypothetical protein [Limnoraphis robusta]|uniref:DUF2281 domain-containing protein n=1 Tax=Limnoraphis robusta CCNP1315 TaxID=3110306 RepID=A0ABU5TTI6_9CYAN|nr:hypothetical protein [Limnoraphis robusta]MEA5517363.1 hypothetical protein [Limnoraphis robusta CCNP1315]MEA5546048.1 hypothetical protein [Limnoraphis robusta CCNP1324]